MCVRLYGCPIPLQSEIVRNAHLLVKYNVPKLQNKDENKKIFGAGEGYLIIIVLDFYSVWAIPWFMNCAKQRLNI